MRGSVGRRRVRIGVGEPRQERYLIFFTVRIKSDTSVQENDVWSVFAVEQPLGVCLRNAAYAGYARETGQRSWDQRWQECTGDTRSRVPAGAGDAQSNSRGPPGASWSASAASQSPARRCRPVQFISIRNRANGEVDEVDLGVVGSALDDLGGHEQPRSDDALRRCGLTAYLSGQSKVADDEDPNV